MNRHIVAAAAWPLAACAAPQLAPATAPLAISIRADSAEYAPYARNGTAAINGQSFLTTRGGDVKLGAGRTVTLDPATAYAREWHMQTSRNISTIEALPPDSLFLRYRRTTTVDARGTFRFAGVPAGSYIVRSSVTWETGASFDGLQGGIVADVITVNDAEQRDLILNRVVSSDASGVGPVPIVGASEIGKRTYSKLRDVAGVSCRRSAFTDPEPTETAARFDLGVQAGKIGASAVINVVCKSGGVSMRRNCFSFIECIGDAIYWTS